MSAPKDLGKTSIGMDANVAALLSYLVGLVSGLIFFLIEKENKFVRFHALQSLFTFAAFAVLNIVLGMATLGFALPLLSLAELALWIVLMVKAYQGEMFKLPVVGDLAAKHA
jgi:uncharacterized membrane protein